MLGNEGAKYIAEGIAVSALLTAADLRYNGFDANAKQELRNAVKDRTGFRLDM